MHEYINLNGENLESEHLCCAIGDPKHQAGVEAKKAWLKNKFAEGHVFRKLNARGKTFIEYEPLETAWVPIVGKNYLYIYCLWVAGSFKGQGIAKELLEYAIADAKKEKKSGLCTLVASKKRPFLGEKKFFEHFGFRVVDAVADYELLVLSFDDEQPPQFSDTARKMTIDEQDFTIYYSNECPYVEHQVAELREYALQQKIKLNFIKVDSLQKAKNLPCIFNNWANFYRGKFVSHQLLNAKTLEHLLK
ncbi:GNAT family N-acetyltransferase [bacterium]|nr:GNAT family N-acetyltransferase [bacterium]MBQ6436740.1 GNAT family N-acetyltransferase [bacterium]